MDTLVEVRNAYREVWTSRPFSNVGVIASWGRVVVKSWIRGKQAGEDNYSPAGATGSVEDAIGLASTDCAVFAIQVANKIGDWSWWRQHAHNGGHDCLAVWDGPDVVVIADSSAREAFRLQQGRAHSLRRRNGRLFMWTLKRGKIIREVGTAAYEWVGQDESYRRTNLIQWASDNVMVLFHGWKGGKGTNLGLIEFNTTSGKLFLGWDKKTSDIVPSNTQNVLTCIEALDNYVTQIDNAEVMRQWGMVEKEFLMILFLWRDVKQEEET